MSNVVLALLVYGLLMPVPCLALLGALQQRHKAKQETARQLILMRIARGGRRRV